MILDLTKAFVTENYIAPVACTLNLSDVDFFGVYALKKPIELSGEVVNKAGVVLLKMHGTACYEAPCDRCGEIAAKDIRVNIEHILATELENEDNDDIILVADRKLNLDELCRTDVLLQIPMKHLCREECRGLCPECGKNLNENECGCGKKEIDPRLAALADLLN